MGAGNSSFTIEQTREITQQMKIEYENCQKKGLTLEEEQQYLQTKYSQLVNSTNSNFNSASSPSSGINILSPSSLAQPKAVVANSRRLSRGYSKDEHGIQPKNVRTRRRSFDNKPTPNVSPKKGKEMQESISTPSLEAKVLEEPPAQGNIQSIFSSFF